MSVSAGTLVFAACVFVCGGQEGVQDRGTDVCCIVVVCVNGRGPGAAFVSLAFKSTRLHSAASCLPSSPLHFLLSLEGRQSCVWRMGLPWLSGGGSSSPFCRSLPPPSSLTGDCWRSQLASFWPIRSIWYRRRRRREMCPSVARLIRRL